MRRTRERIDSTPFPLILNPSMDDFSPFFRPYKNMWNKVFTFTVIPAAFNSDGGELMIAASPRGCGRNREPATRSRLQRRPLFPFISFTFIFLLSFFFLPRIFSPPLLALPSDWQRMTCPGLFCHFGHWHKGQPSRAMAGCA